MNYDALVVASGKARRSGLGYNKAFYKMKNGQTVLENACKNFLIDEDCKHIIIVTDEKEKVFSAEKVLVTPGGETRTDSVKNGLKLVKEEFVFIHDAARPFLKKEDLEELKKVTEETDAALLAIKATDTIKYINPDLSVKETLDRDLIYLASTPQAFKTSLIKEAYGALKGPFTDDCSVVEQYGHPVKVVPCDNSNIKLTIHRDFEGI